MRWEIDKKILANTHTHMLSKRSFQSIELKKSYITARQKQFRWNIYDVRYLLVSYSILSADFLFLTLYLSLSLSSRSVPFRLFLFCYFIISVVYKMNWSFSFIFQLQTFFFYWKNNTGLFSLKIRWVNKVVDSTFDQCKGHYIRAK